MKKCIIWFNDGEKNHLEEQIFSHNIVSLSAYVQSVQGESKGYSYWLNYDLNFSPVSHLET